MSKVAQMKTYIYLIIGFLLFFNYPIYILEAAPKGRKTSVFLKEKSRLKVIPYYIQIDYGSDDLGYAISPSQWDYSESPSYGYTIPKFETQCGGIAYLLLKGKAKNLHIYIKCKDGTVMYRKSHISVNGKRKIFISNPPKDLFSGCSQKFDEDQHFYEEYDVFIEEDGMVIFQAEIIRRECYE